MKSLEPQRASPRREPHTHGVGLARFFGSDFEGC